MDFRAPLEGRLGEKSMEKVFDIIIKNTTVLVLHFNHHRFPNMVVGKAMAFKKIIKA
jgi:hypothetical protein